MNHKNKQIYSNREGANGSHRIDDHLRVHDNVFRVHSWVAMSVPAKHYSVNYSWFCCMLNGICDPVRMWGPKLWGRVQLKSVYTPKSVPGDWL